MDLVKTFSDNYKQHYTHTLDVTVSESSGYTILGNWAMLVRNTVAKKYPQERFLIKPQFCIANRYYADEATSEALVAIVTGLQQVLVVWEYKPKVSSDLDDQTPWHLSEVFLQAMYLQKDNIIGTVLHCLTDLKDNHYFLITANGRKKLQIDKYVYLRANLDSTKQVITHLKFLCHHINI